MHLGACRWNIMHQFTSQTNEHLMCKSLSLFIGSLVVWVYSGSWHNKDMNWCIKIFG